MDTIKFYRLVDSIEQEGVIVRAKVFESIKETPCGHWVIGEYAPRWLDTNELIKRRFAKWISKTSAKKFCYQDLDEAKKSFSRRKGCQVYRLKRQLEQAEKSEKNKEWQNATLEALKQGFNVGVTSFHHEYVFDF